MSTNNWANALTAYLNNSNNNNYTIPGYTGNSTTENTSTPLSDYMYALLIAADTDKNRTISLAEYQDYLESKNLPVSLASRAVSLFGSNGGLNTTQLTNMFNWADAQGTTNSDGTIDTDSISDGMISFSENLKLQNRLSGITIDPAIDQRLYNSYLSNAQNFLKKADTTGNGLVDISEIRVYLENNNYDPATAQAFLNHYDKNNNGIDVLEFLQQTRVDYNTAGGEIGDSRAKQIVDYNLTSGTNPVLRQQTQFQSMAKSFVKAVDGIKDDDGNVIDPNGSDLISRDELRQYLGKQYINEDMADSFFNRANTGSNANYITKEELASMYQSFSGGDDSFDFTDSIRLQNAYSGVTINVTEDQESQYKSLFNSALAYMKKLDTTKDGEVSMSEVKNFLYNNNMKMGDANILDFIHVFNPTFNPAAPGASSDCFNLFDIQKKFLALDTDKDGKLTSATKDKTTKVLNNDGELYELQNAMKDMSNIEIAAKNFIKTVDKGTTSVPADDKLSIEELKAYYTKNGLPPSMADSLVLKYDLYETDPASGNRIHGHDGLMDFQELADAYDQFDNKTTGTTATGTIGTLDFDEQVAFQNSIAGIHFNTTDDSDPNYVTEAQYTNLVKSAQTFMKLDVNADGYVDINEYRAAMDAQNAKTTTPLPECYSENMMMFFDSEQSDGTATPVPKDGKIDMFEYIQGALKLDGNNDGTLDAGESVVLKNKLSNTRLFDQVNTIYTDYDYDNDKTLSQNEYEDYLASQGYSAGFAQTAIGDYDLDGDGSLGRNELMNAYKLFDVNNNYKLDVDEELTYYTGATVVGATPSQLTNIQNFIQNHINTDIDTSSISVDELESYFSQRGLPVYLANNIIANYGNPATNTIGKVNLINILANNQINPLDDLNKTEQLKLAANLSGIDLNVNTNLNPATINLNKTQYTSLFNNLTNTIKQFDLNSDNQLNNNELGNYLTSIGLTSSDAGSFITTYELGNNGNIDVLEFINAEVNFDADDSGDLNYTEQQNLNNSFANIPTGEALQVNIDNQVQIQNLSNIVDADFASVDINGDNILKYDDVVVYFQNNNLPSYLVDRFIADYGDTTTNTITKQQFLKAYADFDRNNNGVFEFNEQLAFDIAQTNVQMTSDTTNEKQNKVLYTSINQSVNTYDITSDKKLNALELSNYYTAKGIASNQVNEAINIYDVNGDSALDAIELLKADSDFDTNLDGTLDKNELFVQSSRFANIILPPEVINSTNGPALWNLSSQTISAYDADKDGSLSSTEIGQWLKSLNMSQPMADNFTNQYRNTSGIVDSSGLLNSFIAIDQNKSGSLETSELITLLQNVSGIDLTSGYASSASVTGLYNAAASMFSYDPDNDKRLNSSEFDSYFIASGITSTTQLTNAKASFDLNNDGYLDFAEWLKTVETFDTNKNGIWEMSDKAALINAVL